MNRFFKHALIVILLVAITLPASLFVRPQKTEASWFGMLKELGLDVAVNIVGVALVDKMVNKTVNWASGGFEGNPLAIQDLIDIYEDSKRNMALITKDGLMRELSKRDGQDEQRFDDLVGARDKLFDLQRRKSDLEKKVEELELTDPFGDEIGEVRNQLQGVTMSISLTTSQISSLEQELEGSPLASSVRRQEEAQGKRQEKLDEIEIIEAEIVDLEGELLGLEEELDLADELGGNKAELRKQIGEVKLNIEGKKARIRLLEGQMKVITAGSNFLPETRVGYARDAIRFLGVVTAAREAKREYDLDMVIQEQCSASVEDYYNDFSVCGWVGWHAQYSNEKNNTLGAQLSALGELTERLGEAETQVTREATFSGILPEKECLDERELSDGSVVCLRERVLKPSALVAERITTAVGLGEEQIGQMRDISDLARYALRKLINQSLDIAIGEAQNYFTNDIANQQYFRTAAATDVFSEEGSFDPITGQYSGISEEGDSRTSSLSVFSVISQETSDSGFDPVYISRASTVVNLEDALLGTKIIQRDDQGVPVLDENGTLQYQLIDPALPLAEGNILRTESNLSVLQQASDVSAELQDMFNTLEQKAYEADVCALGPDFKYKTRMKKDFETTVGVMDDRDKIRDLELIFDKGVQYIDDQLLFVANDQSTYYDLVAMRELATSVLRQDKTVAFEQANSYRRASAVYNSVLDRYNKLKSENSDLDSLSEDDLRDYYTGLDQLARQLNSASSGIVFGNIVGDLELSIQELESTLKEIDKTLDECWAERVLLPRHVNTYDASGLLYCPFEQSILGDGYQTGIASEDIEYKDVNGRQYVISGVFDVLPSDIISALSRGPDFAAEFRKNRGRFQDLEALYNQITTGPQFENLSVEDRIPLGRILRNKVLDFRKDAKIRFVFDPLKKTNSQDTRFDVLPCRAFYYTHQSDYVVDIETE